MRGEDRPPEGTPPAQELEARSGSHRERYEGKIDPSRELASGDGRRADDPGDRDALRDFVGDGDWPHGVAGGGIFHGNGNCNNAGHDHSEDRDKTPRRREESDTRAGERP